MTDLTASFRNQLAGRFVRPAYLVKIKYNTVQYFRWCTGENSIDWDGDPGFAYYLQGLDIKNLGWDLNAAGKISIKIQNLDNVAGQVLLSNDMAGLPVQIWIIYLYDKNVMYAGQTHTAGSTSITTSEPIPKDIPSTGTVYLSETQSVPYSSFSGCKFICSALPRSISSGEPLYLTRTGSYRDEDAFQVFDGVTDETEISEKECVITCVPDNYLTKYTPRKRISKDNGFNVLPQSGLQVPWGSEVFILEKADY